MLARLKVAEPDVSHFRRALKLPRPSAEYLAAEQVSRRASSDLRHLTERRETLKLEAGVENPGREKLSDHTLRAMLDDLEAKITAAQVHDREARAEFDMQKTAFREHVRMSLAADIEGLGALINRHIDQVFELLDIAGALSAEAREQRVEMPGLISDAAAAKRLIESVAVTTIAKMTAGKGARA